jgi:polyribonucleotide nucleotidyltransferase
VRGLTLETCKAALERARQVRLEILKTMLATIAEPRAEISRHAPRLIQIKINPDKIGKVIGPGGKTIKGLEADTGARIEVEDDGTITISSVDVTMAEKARDAIESLTAEVQVGRVYNGTVVSIKDFGAFIEIMPGQDGMCHVSELSDKYVKTVAEVVKLGDTIRVKVISVDDTGRVKLSRKAVLKEEKEAAEKKPS